jgi:hypothetical protein
MAKAAHLKGGRYEGNGDGKGGAPQAFFESRRAAGTSKHERKNQGRKTGWLVELLRGRSRISW